MAAKLLGATMGGEYGLNDTIAGQGLLAEARAMVA